MSFGLDFSEKKIGDLNFYLLKGKANNIPKRTLFEKFHLEYDKKAISEGFYGTVPCF